MIILDTDCLTLLQRKRGVGYRELSENLSRFRVDEIRTSIVSFDEQMRGWMAVVARAKTTERLVSAYIDLESFLAYFASLPVEPFTEAAGRHFDELKQQKLRIGTMDLRIASIAISKNAILVSRNLVDFEQIPGLTVEDWTRESYIN
ncbi:MAG: type II toxin-antitoxin system VapC family toxin [Pyrinomonadaceae bacterium]